ncbi:MAG: plasmid stabilization protein [Campylobacterota bacterium]|nr:plasmid stabilization protein [Campylobacterota bacterium]
MENYYQKLINLSLVLEVDPFHSSLKLHKLKGKLRFCHSVSINMKYKIAIDFMIKEKEIISIDIGIHDKVY